MIWFANKKLTFIYNEYFNFYTRKGKWVKRNMVSK